MTIRESDGRIVPKPAEVQSVGEKPSNVGVGKAARPVRDSDRAPSVLRDGFTLFATVARAEVVVESFAACRSLVEMDAAL